MVALCDPPAVDDTQTPSLATLAGIQVAVPLEGPAEIAGSRSPIRCWSSYAPTRRSHRCSSTTTVPSSRSGRARRALSWKVRRAVLLRDARCRVTGCGRRRGLEVHHLVPRSWHGTDDISNLAAVCPAHHRLLIPHGLLALVGNPNLPDGLQLVTASRAPPKVAV
ncbi:MAG TPA: HNH endonuclease signature motif containing protein [Acidimicrobiia bacterium]|nr:HNH endonuclease signature motif containing protein [Acidimicrobiia bacterium]